MKRSLYWRLLALVFIALAALAALLIAILEAQGLLPRAALTRTAFLALWIVLLLLVPAGGLIRWQIVRVLRPLEQPDFKRPVRSAPYDELLPFLAHIETLEEQCAGLREALHRTQGEYATIAEQLNEGLVVLRSDGRVLSVNRSALRLFAMEDEACLGQSFRVLHRSEAFRNLVETALAGRKGELVLSLQGRSYQVVATPLAGEGATLLFLDVTERLEAEKMRREFSANVSHELKTPLQTIRGCAEILQQGLVHPGDVGHFAGRIFAEASRMVTLVEDIIRLSRLDEGAPEPPREPVELLALCRGVAGRLSSAAEQQEVTVQVDGTPAVVIGNRQLLEEMVHNLCDNAVKYNRRGGRVWVTVENTAGGARLRVRDNGIGIPAEHQSRVFERFYRVDKSHSKETGGTGLGLSIVKYAVRHHHAKIELESREQLGSTFTVTFPTPEKFAESAANGAKLPENE